jgi:hypothetical protein
MKDADEFPFSLEDFASTLAQVFADRGEAMQVALLAHGHFDAEYWFEGSEDGLGTYRWTLTLRVQPALFGRVIGQPGHFHCRRCGRRYRFSTPPGLDQIHDQVSPNP